MQTQNVFDDGRSLWGRAANGSSGKWAGERMLKALNEGRLLTTSELRDLDTLADEIWKEFDTVLVREAQIRLRGVADLIAAGLVKRISNGLGKTVLEYQTLTDMDPATVSLDGVTRSENERLDYGTAGIPLPITHKDWYLNIRDLAASRQAGAEPLDTVHIGTAGRKIAEELERMLFQGGKTFGGLPIYGLTTHPSRNTAGFGTNGTWSAAAKTGDNIITDVQTMIAGLEGDRMFGPYALFVPGAYGVKLGSDFKANGDLTIKQRIEQIEGIQLVRVADQMPANTAVMVQLTADVIQMVEGEPLQTVQWDVHGGFQINYKGFTIMVPLIRADAQGRSGVFHMS